MKTLITVFCLLPLLAFFGNNSTKDHSSQNYNISEKTIMNCPEPPSFYEFIDQGKSKSVSQDEIDQDWYSQTIGKIEKEEYNITYNEKLGAYQSPNRANNIRFIYHNDGFTATTRSDAQDWSIRFGITNYELRIENGDFRVDGNKAIIGNERIRIDYANTKEGMRQDFIIKEKPVGNGKLRLNMSVDTKLKMIVGADALMFKDNDGNEKLKYSQLKCWDAEGKELRAYFEKKSISQENILGSQLSTFHSRFSTFHSRFSIVVNDNNATYPITIDPLSTSPDWTAESDQADAQFGYSVCTAGDVNGDGYSDVIVGALIYDNGQTDEGRAFVYHGSATGLSATANWTAESDQENAHFGGIVSTAGDVNGDGYSDVIVGANEYQNGQFWEGRAFVYHGSASGLSATANWTAESDQVGAFFGQFASTAGDVNGDGYSDVIVGAYNYSNGQEGEGRVFVYHGTASGLSASANWTAESDQEYAGFGYSVSTAGDVNGDGYSDVIVGAHYYDNGQSEEGMAFVYHGSPSGLSIPVSWTADGYQGGSQLGISVSTAGDVNGDGYSDVIIGANTYDNGETDEGRAYVFLGSASGLSVSPSWLNECNQAYASFGFRSSTAGDVNGDGFSDVMVSAIRFDDGENDEGKVFLYYGSSSGLSVIPNWTAQCNNPNSLFGYQLKSAGDVNGDGYSDVIIGAADYSNGENYEGKAFAYYGSPSGMSQYPNWVYEINQSMAHLGNSVSSADDVNGDGYSDILVAAMYYSNGQTYEGKVFLFNGSSTGLSNEPVWSAEGNQQECNFGAEVASAGDVNGDGYSDAIVGSWLYDNGQIDEGRVFLYHGSSSGLSSMPNWISESDQSGSLFGHCVSTAGDVNGDGYSDVIVGAPHFENGTWREGSAFVYHGSPTGLSSSPNWTGESNQHFAIYGFSVSTAGDVNGDGFSDVIVGANYYNGHTGKAFVYYGNESGGLRANVRQYKYSTNENISAGGLSGSSGNVRLNMFGKSIFGRTKGKFVIEYKRNGIPFSGNIITNSTAYSGIGLLSNLGTSGTELNQYITGLSVTGEYKWRARVQYDQVSNPYQKYSPWKYFYNYAPVPAGGFKARYVPAQTKDLTLYAVIQGFYDPVTDQMARDTVTVYLRQFLSPYDIIDSAKMYLGANGSATYTYSNPEIINNTQYYIQVKHRNSIETWNKGCVFTNSVQSFSFRNFGSAYGNNQILIDDNPLTYAVYGGDVDQDGTVDAADVSMVDNDAYLFTSGYVKTDLTGDNFVDATDFAIADNNSANFVSVIRP
jgi:hypothetical protein